MKRARDENDLSNDELLAMWNDADPVRLCGGLVAIETSPWIENNETGAGSPVRVSLIDGPQALLR